MLTSLYVLGDSCGLAVLRVSGGLRRTRWLRVVSRLHEEVLKSSNSKP